MNEFLFINVANAASTVDTFIVKANTLIVNPLIALMFALALAYFLYGLVEFIANQDKEDKKTIGKRHILWGLVGMTVMFGVWGILQMVLDTFGITGVNLKTGTVELNPYNPDYSLGGGSGPGGSDFTGGGSSGNDDPYTPPQNPVNPPLYNDPSGADVI